MPALPTIDTPENNFLFMKKAGILLLALGFLFPGCYYDVEEDLYPSLECNTENATYSGTVLPILQQNCYGCHSAAANFGNITLEGYDQLSTYVTNGQFLGAIHHDAGFSPMPKNQAQLLECDIRKIERWIEEGALQN